MVNFEAANIYLFPDPQTFSTLPTAFSPEIFLSEARNQPVVDVRSPAEFLAGHIPGAVNIPLFSNEERAVVGTIYKQQGNQAATLKGLEIVGPKMADFVRQARKISPSGDLLVHCWRGGMRSGSMAWLFETSGMKTATLRGGYKAYRNFILSGFVRPFDLRVVGGETGSGKTEILQAIGRAGQQVLDLEAIARHRGSAFGAIGLPEQPTVEQFENDLFQALQELDPSQPVWIEDESKSIGRVYIPNDFWKMKEAAPVYRIRIPFEVRVQRLLKDYGSFPKDLLSESVKKIAKRLGGLATQQALEALENGDLAETARISLRYYDKCYDFPHADRKYENVFFIDSESGDPEYNAGLILDLVNKQKHS